MKKHRNETAAKPDSYLGIRINEDLKQQLSDVAKREGLKITDIARRAVREFLDRNKAA
jgi:predicted transcriptional regulator